MSKVNLSHRAGFLFLAPMILGLTGCSRSPSFNIMGSFFPAWLVCIALGSLLAFLVHILLAKWQIEPEMKPLVLVYPSIATTFTCLLWLLFFS
jgi:hypothetical protein